MNNRKGFTLVEILAVVAILAILSVAAGVGVSSTINKQKQKLAYTAEKNISDAAVSFFSSKVNGYLKACTDNDGTYVTISQRDWIKVNGDKSNEPVTSNGDPLINQCSESESGLNNNNNFLVG